MAAAIILASAASPERAARIVTRALALNVAAATLLLVIVVEGGPFGNELLTAGRATAVLVLLTAGVGATVASYAGRALAGDPRQKHWHTWTTVLVAATSTTALAGSGPILITGWVMTTVSVVALVGHHSHWIETRRARRRVAAALLVGDGALIAGLALAALTVGNIDFRRPEVSGADLSSQGWPLTVVAVLLVVAAISRSALVPLHRWLPSTLAAPTPVSALLHAGVVNGAGVLLIKTAPITGASAWAMGILLAAGAATAILATGVMIVRADVKGKLAWSTAGQMGFMTVQLAVGAFGAAIFHIVGHAMYKASLFLGSGSAVQAMTVKRRVPAARVATRSRRLTALPPLALGAVATVAAISVLEPSGPAAANLLIGLFGWAMVAQLVTGWLRSVDDTGPAVLTALGAALLSGWSTPRPSPAPTKSSAGCP
jgi:NADH:ubiquinone oxidoreductase subunit 5 (subunit L)/multisubunit Na+/H+ antiporter MnhA subunit